MTMIVQATTDDVPGLRDLIEKRRANGLDIFDEWWEGVYHIVPVPGRIHGRAVVRVGALLDRLAQQAGFEVAAPINIGIDEHDFRVPDIGVILPDTAMTSPAFHATAEMVVEILSPREVAGAKLAFYAAWNVKEYLEVDLESRSCRLLRNDGGDWGPVATSTVIDLGLGEVDAILTDL